MVHRPSFGDKIRWWPGLLVTFTASIE